MSRFWNVVFLVLAALALLAFLFSPYSHGEVSLLVVGGLYLAMAVLFVDDPPRR